MNKDEAYSYLQDIISEGFISLGVEYKGFNIVLKSLTDIEMEYLKKKLNKDQFNKVPMIDRLVYSTYFIQDNNILINRDNNIGEIYSLYGQLPVQLLHVLALKSDILLNKFLESADYLEGFCYTPVSRRLWIVYKNTVNNYTTDDSVGLRMRNSLRDRWIMTNSMLDSEESDSISTDLAIFVASAYNPKGIKSVSNSVKLKREEREKERDEIAEYGFSKKRIEAKKESNKWSKPLVTNEDLVRELRRVSRGDKDRHDLFIDKWIKDKADRARAAKEAQLEKARKYREEIKETTLDREGSRRASPEEMKKILNRDSDKKVHTEKFTSAYEGNGKSDDLMKKIGSRILKSDS